MDKGQDITVTLTMPLGGWEAVMRALEAQGQDVEDEVEQVRLHDALIRIDDEVSDFVDGVTSVRLQP